MKLPIDFYYSETFLKWYKKLKDNKVKGNILMRLNRIKGGNFGNHKYISNGIYELKFTIAGGVRVYYSIVNDNIVLLLVGCNKSTQTKDIKKAIKIKNKYKERKK